MNKQELIKRIGELPYSKGPIADTVTVNRGWILKSIEQLDEPQKPAVPQLVADWYEEHKDDFETELFQCIYKMPNIFEMNKLSKFEEWLIDVKSKPFQTLVNMHQLGYEVEEEKRYLVKMEGMASNSSFLKYNAPTENWYMGNDSEFSDMRILHTRKELEQANFGWVFDCEGIEIEEVEE